MIYILDISYLCSIFAKIQIILIKLYLVTNTIKLNLTRSNVESSYADNNELQDFIKKGVYKYLIPSNVQAAYSITDNIGIILNGFYRYASIESSSIWVPTDSTYRSTILNVDLGLGYFNKIKNNMLFEVYAGAGYGKCDHFHEIYGGGFYYDYHFSSNQLKFFIQPGIGFSKGTKEFAFSAKLVNINFLDVNLYDYYPEYEYIKEAEYIVNNSAYYLIEPALTFRSGGEITKFSLQIISSTKFYGEQLDYSPLTIRLCFNINLTKVLQKKNE